MLKRFRLSTKVVVYFLAVGLIPLVVTGVISLYRSSDAIRSQSFNQLAAVRTIKGQSVQRYLGQIRDQVITFSQNKMVVDLIGHLKDNFMHTREILPETPDKIKEVHDKLRAFYANDFTQHFKTVNRGGDPGVENVLAKLSEDAVTMQNIFLAENPNPVDQKYKMDRPQGMVGMLSYSSTHATMHPAIMSYVEKFGYKDIYLVEPEKGVIIYSAGKNIDFGTSLLEGPFADTNLARCFKEALKAEQSDSFAISEYESYLPAYGAPACFIGSPIFQKDKLAGVAIFQLPLKEINAIMVERTGMGQSGETYLVGPDKLMRSDSFLDSKHRTVMASFAQPEAGKVNTQAARQALAGKTGVELTTNYLGQQVLSAYQPFTFANLSWALVADMSQDEAFAAVDQLVWLSTIVGLVAMAAIVGGGPFNRPFHCPAGGGRGRGTGLGLPAVEQRLGRGESGQSILGRWGQPAGRFSWRRPAPPWKRSAP